MSGSGRRGKGQGSGGGRGSRGGRGSGGAGSSFRGFSGGGNWESNEQLVGYNDGPGVESSGQDADAESTRSEPQRPNPDQNRRYGPARPAPSVRSSEASLGGQANSDQTSTADSTSGYGSKPGTGAGTPAIGSQFRPYGGPQDYDSEDPLAGGLDAERSDISQSGSGPPIFGAPGLATAAANVYYPPSSSSQSVSQSGSRPPTFGVPGLATAAADIGPSTYASSQSISSTVSTMSNKRATSRPRPGPERQTNSQENITALPPQTDSNKQGDRGEDDESKDPKSKGGKGKDEKKNKRKNTDAGAPKGPKWDPKNQGGGAAGGQPWNMMKPDNGTWDASGKRR